MSGELVKRLRAAATSIKMPDGNVRYVNQVAADRIEALERECAELSKEHTDMTWQRRRAEERAESAEAERDKLREALEKIAAGNLSPSGHIARAALKGVVNV